MYNRSHQFSHKRRKEKQITRLQLWLGMMHSGSMMIMESASKKKRPPQFRHLPRDKGTPSSLLVHKTMIYRVFQQNNLNPHGFTFKKSRASGEPKSVEKVYNRPQSAKNPPSLRTIDSSQSTMNQQSMARPSQTPSLLIIEASRRTKVAFRKRLRYVNLRRKRMHHHLYIIASQILYTSGEVNIRTKQAGKARKGNNLRDEDSRT
jgi:hypothetical protein